MIWIILQAVFGWLTTAFKAKADLETAKIQAKRDVDLKQMDVRIAANTEIGLQNRASLGHPVDWIPLFGIKLFVMFWVVAAVIDLIFQLPGDVSEPSGQIATIFGIVIGGMFVQGTGQTVAGTIATAVKSRVVGWLGKKN